MSTEREIRPLELSELRAIALAAHADERDLQGRPYGEHLEAVAGAVSERAQPAAWFHDCIEDRRLPRAVVALLVDDVQMAAIDLLTRRSGSTYAAYIDRIADAPGQAGAIAREVKLADLRHNLGRTPATSTLRGRYQRALARLGDAPA